MFKCLQIMCAKYYERIGICFIKNNCTSSHWRVCLIRRQNSCYFRRPVWKTNSWKKHTYLKT